MRVLATSIAGLLFLDLFASSVLAGYPAFSETLKDPYSGQNALLDIDVQTPCLTSLELKVTIPTTSTDVQGLPIPTFFQGNSYFDGPSFDWRPITGSSQHTNVAQHNSIVWIKWDETTRSLYFKGFSADNGVSGTGKCDYTDTECFTHPGTYMDVLGFSIAESHIRLVAGTHEQGLRVWVNDTEIHHGKHMKQLSSSVTGSFVYHHNGKVDIHTDIMGFEVLVQSLAHDQNIHASHYY